MTLQFIHQGAQGAPTTSDRRLIRSYVMKGKNAGRPRRSTKKQTTSFHVKRVLTTPGLLMAASGPKQPLWHDLCLTSFPQQLDAESVKIMHRWFFDISDELFPPQFCSKFDIIKSIWVNGILADEAYFHSTLAISSSYLSFYQRKPSITTKTLHHIVKAYELVNVRLSGPESVSDSAIAAVVSLVIYQQIHQGFEAALVHLNGLYQMVKLRGGIPQLMKGNRALAMKILRQVLSLFFSYKLRNTELTIARVDVELALQTGSATLFSSKALPNAVAADSPFATHIGGQFPGNSTTSTGISDIMVDVLGFAHLLNYKEDDDKAKLDPLTFMEILVSLLYRLVEMTPFGHPKADYACTMVNADDEIAHLGMLAFMTTFLPEYGRAHDRSSYPLLHKHLERAIGYIAFIDSVSKLNDSAPLLLLWTLFMTEITVRKNRERTELSPLIMEISKRLGLRNWVAVRKELCRLPWIHVVHDAPGYKLWQDLERVDKATRRMCDN